MKEHKMHYFDDCTGFPWQRTLPERSCDLTTRVAHVTCGQCKDRILDVLRNEQWIFLTTDEITFLERLAMLVKR